MSPLKTIDTSNYCNINNTQEQEKGLELMKIYNLAEVIDQIKACKNNIAHLLIKYGK
jgi:hypothetical protein